MAAGSLEHDRIRIRIDQITKDVAGIVDIADTLRVNLEPAIKGGRPVPANILEVGQELGLRHVESLRELFKGLTSEISETQLGMDPELERMFGGTD